MSFSTTSTRARKRGGRKSLSFGQFGQLQRRRQVWPWITPSLESSGPLDAVLQFADVARPVVGHIMLMAGVEMRRTSLPVCGVLLDEVVGQQEDVVAAPERRDEERETLSR